MDPSESNVGDNSQGHLPGANSGPYQPSTWNPYMYGYQQPPGYVYQQPPGLVPQGFQPRLPNFPMMNPSAYAPEAFPQAEISQSFVQHVGANVAGGSASASKKRNKSSGTRTKLSNFNPDEDKYIVQSWLEISCDPITNTGQKRDGLWDRIMHRYNSRRGTNPERSLKSIQCRWDLIRTEVTLFAGFYADSIRENPSGMSDADKTTHAVANYAAVLKKKFAYVHCWELMKDAPKWQDPNGRDNVAAARGEGFGEQSTAANETVQVGEGQSRPDRSGAHERRPMGRDAAKAAKKKANSDAGSSSSAEYTAKMEELSLQKMAMMQVEADRRNDRYQHLACIDEQRLEEMRKNNQAMIQIEQDKLRLAREQHEEEKRREEKREDERILKIDLDACPPKLRAYYQLMQDEILDRARSRRRQGE